MRNYNCSIYFLLIISSLFGSCKKIPNKLYKQIDGKWNVTGYFVDGVDSTDYLLSSPNYCPLSVYNSYNNRLDYLAGQRYGTGNFYNKTSLLMNFQYTDSLNNGIGPYLAPLAHDWDIIKLCENEMILSTKYNNKKYTCNFKK
jgi:hypothetical protein